MSEEKQFSDLDKKKHTGAHILASAVAKHLEDEKVDIKFGIGPPIEYGFYYDFDLGGRALTEADFKGIEKAMKHIVKQNLPFVHREVSIAQAREISKDQPYKLELLADFEAKGITTVTYYSIGKFEDLCRGNHVDSTGKVGAFKIDKVAGAYWKGDEKNPMMQRIYVLMFDTQEELDAHVAMLEEAKKRDHRKLGKELDLFAFSDLIGPGLPLFTPRGTILRDELTRYVIELQEPLGYKNVDIPHLTNTDLYKTSGHYDKYGEDLFKFNMGEREFAVKPMNCPHHTQIFDSRQRSYKEMPIAYYNITKVYRNEQSGELQGLSRVLSITQDDGHVFCRPDQIQQEAGKIYSMIKTFYETLGMKLHVRLSRRDPQNPDKYLGDDALWLNAESALKEVLSNAGITEFIDGPGEAAFYGPKLDFMIKDAIGREWQVATIQLDFNMPMRFNLSYVDETNQKQHPVMIHRAVLGSVERFMSIMIEHFGGNFPTWMSPEQVRILPISDNFIDHAKDVYQILKSAGVRVEIDDRAESLGKKIREAEIWKVPYSLIIGEKEVAAKTVTPRKRHTGDMPAVSAQEFADMIIKEIKERSL